MTSDSGRLSAGRAAGDYLAAAVDRVEGIADPELRKIAFEAELGRADERRKRIDRLFGYFTALVTVIAGGLGVFVTASGYIDSKAKEADARLAEAGARRAEALRPFMETRRERYNEILKVVGSLAAPEQDPKQLEASKRRFWELYWAELSLVEDKEVETAMIGLGKLIGPDRPPTPLQNEVYRFAHLIRDKVTRLEAEGSAAE